MIAAPGQSFTSTPSPFRPERVITVGTMAFAASISGVSLPSGGGFQVARPGGFMEAVALDREQVGDMISASEARTEARFERGLGEIRTLMADVRGDLRAIDAKIGERATTLQVIGIVASGVVTAVTTILIILAYNGDTFSRGFDASDIAERAAERAISSHAKDQAPVQPKQMSSAPPPKK